MHSNLLLLILASLYFHPQACTLCDACLAACFSCVPNSSRNSWITTQCDCNDGFYDNNGSSCLSCHATCLTCNGPSDAACLSCSLHASLTSGKCPCDSGYYFDTGASACELCHSECLTCSLAGNSGCKTCFSHASLVNTAPAACQCDIGWWPNLTPSTCSACSNLCLRCADSSASKCTQCKSGAVLASTAPASCICSQTYFPNPNSGSCAICDTTCLGCSAAGPLSCSSCRVPAVLQGSKCECPSNTFPNTDASNCVFCAIECLTCSTAAATGCQSCKANASQSTTPGACSCTGGFYGLPNACIACDPTCLTCSGGFTTSCLQCKPHASLQGSSAPNLCTCDDSFFPDSTAAHCSSCDITCFNCGNSADNSCVSCYSNAELYQGVNPGKCVCLSNYFPNPHTGNCAICEATCASCVAGDALSCTVCQLNAQLERISPGKCLCSDSHFPNPTPALCTHCHSTCLLCTGPTSSHCSACHDFAMLATPSPSLCQCVPEAFTLSDASHCGLCSIRCLTCSDAGHNYCLSCKLLAYLQGPAPSECVCSPGSFPDPDVSLCSPCAALCKDCVSREQCVVCKEKAALVSGKCGCAEGFYVREDGLGCEECTSGCGKCLPTGCFECFPGHFLLDGSCVSSCPPGYTSLLSNTCQLSSPPLPSLSSEVNNTLLLTFTRPMNCSLTASDISIQFQPLDTSEVYWQDPVSSDSQHYWINMTIGEMYMPNGTIANLTFVSPESVVDVNGEAIDVNWVVTAMQGYGLPTSSTPALLSSSSASQSAAVSKGGVSAGLATSLLNGNPASILSLVNQLQLVSYLAMSKIPIPEEFASTLAGMNVGQMLPNPTANLFHFSMNYSSQTPPGYVQDYGIETMLFLENAKSVLMTAAAILMSYFPIYLLSKVPSKPISLYFQRLLQSLRWGVLLNIWFTSYLDLSVFVLLQVTNVGNSFHSYFPGLSLCIALVFLLIIAITPILLVFFLKMNWENVVMRTNSGFNKRWGALIAAFKPSNHLSSVAYYPIFLLRRLTLAITLTLLPDRVYLLACLNTSIALISVLYVLIFRPYIDPLDVLEASTSEISTFLIYAISSVFVLEISEKARKTLGKIGAWVSKATVGIAIAVSLLRTLVGVWRVLKLYRQHTKGKYGIRTVGPESEISTSQNRVPITDIA